MPSIVEIRDIYAYKEETKEFAKEWKLEHQKDREKINIVTLLSVINDDVVVNNEGLASKRFRPFNEDMSYVIHAVWRNRGQTFCANIIKMKIWATVVNPRRDDDDCRVVIVAGWETKKVDCYWKINVEFSVA